MQNPDAPSPAFGADRIRPAERAGGAGRGEGDGLADLIHTPADVEHGVEDVIYEVAGAINGHDDVIHEVADAIQRVVVIINGLEGSIYGHDGTIHALEDVINGVEGLIQEVEDLEKRLADRIQTTAVSKEAKRGPGLRQAGGLGPAPHLIRAV